MKKSQLRIKYKKLREEIPAEKIGDLSIEIANNLLKLPIWNFSYYHLFLSISDKREIDTQAILHILQGKDKNVVLSRSDFENKHLRNFLLTDSSILKTNKYGIPEPIDGIEVPPDKIDVVFLPLLAFDEKGNRIGYGKGFYDRFLSSCTGKTLKIGLSFFEAELEFPETSEHDIPLDHCVTPHKIYNFQKSQ